MKRALVLILCLLLTLYTLPAKSAGGGDGCVELWALIVGGSFDYPHQFLWDGYYLYYLLTRRYQVTPDHIMWLYWEGDANEIEPDSIDGVSTKTNVRNAITSWLKTNADGNDNVFIYLECHGSGFNITSGEYPEENYDANGDEGNEHYNPTCGWFGVDESLLTYYGQTAELYYDDELATDLNEISEYGNLIILIGACVVGNYTCHGGGFIDDISGENRVIITSSNETGVSYCDTDYDGYSEFEESFFDALWGYNTTYDGLGGIITHWDQPINADFDGNGRISMQEAFDYALENDEAHLMGLEYPWLDCDGDGLPTYKNGTQEDEDQPPANVYLEAPVCAMKTLTNGYFYMPNIPGLCRLRIELLFNDSRLEGDQTHTSPPYETISHWPSGTVDISDLVFVLGKVGISEGSAGWDYMADVIPNKVVDVSDLILVINHIPSSGNYITAMSNVVVIFNNQIQRSPDSYRFIDIPQGAKNFTIYKNGNCIGALVTFWRTIQF
jgi:hypothetical protein